MRGTRIYLGVGVLSFALLTDVVSADPINVALGKPVTLAGTFGVITFDPRWGDSSVYPLASASSLTDGVFLPEGTYWQAGSVWWDTRAGDAAVEVNLQGLFQINGLTIQADNNDSYNVLYRDRLGEWLPMWEMPWRPPGGQLTRPAPGMVHYLGDPVLATAIRLVGPPINPDWGISGNDGWYSVVEIQAFGHAVPEPGSLLLLASGVAALRLVRRRVHSAGREPDASGNTVPKMRRKPCRADDQTL